MTIQTLTDCWVTASPSYIFNPPATEAKISEVETKLGLTIPHPLHEIYRFTNGDWVLGNLRFFPIEPTPDDWGLTNANEKYIEWGWHIPQEILLFADNGGEEAFGIWLPETGNPIFENPIIEVGELPGEEGCMGIAGTNLVSFLLGLTADDLIDRENDAQGDVEDGEDLEAPHRLKQLQTALDRLQVPEDLRMGPFYDSYKEQFGIDYTEDRVERHFPLIRKWAAPTLPDPYGDSYTQ